VSSSQQFTEVKTQDSFEPIAEVQGSHTLEDQARLFAQNHQLTEQLKTTFNLENRLDGIQHLLDQSYQKMQESSDTALTTSYATEWMLDNFYIVQQSIRQIREDMPPGFYQQLPKIECPTIMGAPPRIYAFVCLFLQSCQAQVDVNRLERFVRSFQEVTALSIGELWALPVMLRFGILLCLAHAIVKITNIKPPADLKFFWEKDIPHDWDEDTTISCSILSLRAVSAIQWKDFVENVSWVNTILCKDPTDTYTLMDFETRDRYRGIVEKLARGSGVSEGFVAEKAIQLSKEYLDTLSSNNENHDQDKQTKIPPQAHVGYYLIDHGRPLLEAAIQYTPTRFQRLSRFAFRNAESLYFGSIVLLTGCLLGFAIWYAISTDGSLIDAILPVLFGLIPAMSIAIGFSNWLFTQLISPNVLPKMDFSEGLPPNCKSIVAIPCLLIDIEEVDHLLETIELHSLGNRDPYLSFALLSDFMDASDEHTPEDNMLLNRAIKGIRLLNQKYPQRSFLLLHRPRKWNPGEECWMGWERKRGKLSEFNQLILGKADGFCEKIGDLEALKELKYVITLDADTSLPRGSAHKLVATLAHPLNRAQFTHNGKIQAGYSILQPRVQIRPEEVNQTRLTRISAGETGLDPYTLAVSDIYQDLFGVGIFVGKGIYDIAAFDRSMDGKAPQNSLLSHDLFEGIHGRVGLATDINLFEGYPANYIVNVRRKHRWVRGDWQIAPWLLPRVPDVNREKIKNDLGVINRWKIFDNLRRSLYSLSLLIWFIFSWLIFPGSSLLWTSLGLLALGIPVIIVLLGRSVKRGKEKFDRRTDLVSMGLGRVLLTLVMLPYEALIMTDAIISTFLRMMVTHKHLLQWSTTAHTIRLFGRRQKLSLVWTQMTSAVYFSLIVAVLILLINPHVFLIALPFLVTWLLSPWFAQWISQPIANGGEQLPEDQLQQLRKLACRTWMFFEHFVTPEGNWLPPDHYQEQPRGIAVNHTSPTNMGLFLISTLAAHDLGYISRLSLELRLTFTLETMNKLERYQGHFLNWYDISTLRTLHPRYISTVDSGNLAGCLFAIIQGIDDVCKYPLMRRESWLGFFDTISVLIECISHMHLDEVETTSILAHLGQMKQAVSKNLDSPEKWPNLLLQLSEHDGIELSQLMVAFAEKSTSRLEAQDLIYLRTATERLLYHIDQYVQELNILAPWVNLRQNIPEFFKTQIEGSPVEANWLGLFDGLELQTPIDQMPEMCKDVQTRLRVLLSYLEIRQNNNSVNEPETTKKLVSQAFEWCQELDRMLETSKLNMHALLIGYQDTRNLANQFINEMDFGFLFHPQRQVFHIGYNLDLEKRDDNFYDLLASEARLASYIAIAKSDVPQSHWLHLARPITKVGNTPTLLSWSGTMFEYLMPHLLMQRNPRTLLDQSCRAAVQQQINYGHQKNTPWGISESGFYHFDNQQNYQYRAFGTPGLGFKRGLDDDLVIAPYASMLALNIEPEAVMRNIAKLSSLDAIGCYGFYESLDFTATRLTAGEQYRVVRSYYAHHQGMIIAELANFLLDKILVHRFHANPAIQSVDLLLYELLPRNIPIEKPQPDIAPITHPLQQPLKLQPWQPPLDARTPQVHVLSNGRFSTLITHHGSGYCSWKGDMLTRWRSDPTLDNWGTWIYIRDEQHGDLWSATKHPTRTSPSSYQVTYRPASVSFHQQTNDITSQLQIAIHPQDDLEIRLLSLSNHSGETRELTITSYGEVCLAPLESDRRHPAFNKLFIASEYIDEDRTILYSRRPRSRDEKLVFLAHALVLPPKVNGDVRYICSRRAFLGRNGDPKYPNRFRKINSQVTTDLDPIFSLSITLTIPPHQSREVAFLTSAAATREDTLAEIRNQHVWARLVRIFDQASSFGEQVLGGLDMDTDELAQGLKILSLLLYQQQALRASTDILAANTLGQPGLWKFAISGDHPIILARIGSEEEINLVVQLLKCHAYWRSYNLKIDLVLVNLSDTSYDQELQNLIFRVLVNVGAEIWLNKRGGIFMLRDDQLSPTERILLLTVAKVVLDGDRGSLANQLADIFKPERVLPRFVVTTPTLHPITTPILTRPEGLLFDNGVGGFSPDGKEYQIYLQSGQTSPAPWVNVIANPDFGSVVSESGLGYSWAGNSSENRLTPWRNDPIIDLPGEALYIRDEETGRVWSPTPMPFRSIEPYLIRHGAGYSIFEHNSHGIRQHVRVFVVRDAPIKVVQLELENTVTRTRRVTVTYYAEWVLGPARELTQGTVIPEFDARNAALLARNAYNTEFGERVAFLASTREPTGLTADRTEFLGASGDMRNPAALRRVGLSGNVKVGADPCAALQTLLWIAPGETKEVTFILGQGDNREHVNALLSQYRKFEKIEESWKALNNFWDGLLGRLTVKTPDKAMDIMLNRWLRYQTLACRIWGRTALYQSSGAFGFRDQLQDALAFVDTHPAIPRSHILEAAGHQFEAGDVLHWWHPPSGRGVRTRCSDDLLWLPYCTAQYINHTGDLSILDEKILFLEGAPLGDEHESYAHYQPSATEGTLLEHCYRALERGKTRGAHGLPLIGSHDWNDGLSGVGVQGKGESVWNGWFLYQTLIAFADLCERLDERKRAGEYRQQAQQYLEALEKHAWDGDWYLRAFYDDGTPMGSAQNLEGQIDSLPQSWSVLSGAALPGRARQAMAAVFQKLVNTEEQMILLFSPPFEHTEKDPGYIKGYPPGVRENGGQYTHAANWVVWAFAELGEGDRAGELFKMLNPIYHASTDQKRKCYQVEPYVVAADVYGAAPYTGRGGWTWYTGSAGWMYRLGVEAILGIHKEGDILTINPCIPKDWPEFEMTYHWDGSEYLIKVENPEGVCRGVRQIYFDGKIISGGSFPLKQDRQAHQITVRLGAN